jgi:hypothetical protein
MMTVRFPNGQAVQYNNARHVNRYDTYSDIYEREGGIWIAQVPNTCIIESQAACRVYDGIEDMPKGTDMQNLTKIIQELKKQQALLVRLINI